MILRENDLILVFGGFNPVLWLNRVGCMENTTFTLKNAKIKPDNWVRTTEHASQLIAQCYCLIYENGYNFLLGYQILAKLVSLER